VARSRGYAVLDEAARTMISQSAELTPLPVELRGKAFSLELPVLFNIADEVAGSARAEPAE
jgi:outer membrane biosynthesis protein TonB